jgi:NAD(P)-dependent dehydrogenase (short-subunit alcohol dehydrogenase family)
VPAGRVSLLPADLADKDDRGRAVAAAVTAGRVDILVNNAATPTGNGAIWDVSTAPAGA